MVIMGTGTSIGVPVVGCTCDVCTSEHPRNRRLRSGVLIQAPQGEFVIDAGPELRLQLLASGARMIRAAIFTHAHADHVMGIDDLRIFAFRLEKELLQADRDRAAEHQLPFDESKSLARTSSNIPLFCEPVVEENIRQIFHYAFSDPAQHSHRFAAPRLTFETVEPGKPFRLLGLDVLPIRLHHGKLPILGYRINDVAFCTDVSTIPAESRELLEGLDVLIIDALRDHPHPTHLSVDQAVGWAQKLQPRRTYLTHMSHDLDYESLKARLPDGIEPAWDGLRIPLHNSAKQLPSTADAGDADSA